MADQPPELELSPLDQIRQTEAEVTRKIAATRKVAEQLIEDAHKQAAILKREARESGTREGQVRYKALISKTEEEAQALIAEAQSQAKKLRRHGKERMQIGVNRGANFVINLAEDTKDI